MPNRTTTPVPVPVRPTPAGTRRAQLAGPVPVLAAALLWGTTGTTAALAPAAAPAAAVGCAGLVLGGLLLFLTARRPRPAWTRRERWLLAAGIPAVAGYPMTFYPAVARTGVAVATVIALGSAPVFAGLLAWAFDQHRPTARWAAGTATAVAGCALLVLGGAAGTVDLPGVLLAATAGLSYAAYSLLGGRLIAAGRPSDAVMGVLFSGAGLAVLPLVLALDTAWLATVRGAGAAGYLAVFTVFLAYRLFGYGLRRTPAATATALTLAEPAVAAVLGVAVLGERLAGASWCGLAVLGAGLVLLTASAG